MSDDFRIRFKMTIWQRRVRKDHECGTKEIQMQRIKNEKRHTHSANAHKIADEKR